MKRCSESRSLVMLIAVLALLPGWVRAESAPDRTSGRVPELSQMDTLVTTEWLSQHLADPDLVVLDCSVTMTRDAEGNLLSSSGRNAYESGHIPSAGFADLTAELCDRNSPFPFAVPTPEELSAAMGALGVGNDSRVVLYDGRGWGWAARVWWMLRWIGFDRAAVLDGGLQAWTAEGRPLSTEPASRPAQQLTPVLRPRLIADRDEVRAAITDDAVHLVDAMHEVHFRGEMAMYDRAGHIPGASNIPSMALLDESGHYRPLDELNALHQGDRNARFITYCGAGIAASSNAFIMTRLGFTDVAVYTGSLQEWAADTANPLVTDKP